MKILLVNNFLSPAGGTETYLSALGSLLQEKGHTVHYFATNKQPFFVDEPESAYFPAYLDYRSADTFQLARHALRPFYNREAYYKLRRQIQRQRPDLAHMHCIYYHLSPSVIQACRDEGVPVAMTLHDIRFLCPSGLLMKSYDQHCEDRECIREKPFNCLAHRCKYGSWKASLLAVSEYYVTRLHGLYNAVDRFFCPSQAVYDLCIQAGIPKQKLHVLPHFVPRHLLENGLNNLSAGPSKPHDNPKHFLFAGRLAKEKGIHHLLRAIAMLPNAELRIAGSGEYETPLKTLAQSLAPERIRFLGRLDTDMLRQEYRHCLAVVSPSICFETFGLSILEAFSYGKPVIASEIGAFPEWIQDGWNGFLVKSGCPEALAGKMQALLADPLLAGQMGLHARSCIDRFDKAEQHYDKLMAYYPQLYPCRNE